MFCTNCGEEMRATDKFCANCGAAAAPRPAKPRAAATVPPDQPTLPRPSRSTAEAFHAPLPATSTNAPNVNRPTSSFKTEAAGVPPFTRQQEQQVLLEAEEIASVRGMLPIDALPPEFPPAVPVTDTQRCEHCGERNPAGNGFCEKCGRALQADAAVQSPPAPASVTQNTWLDVPGPARAAAAKPVRTPAAAKDFRPPAAATTKKDEDFFYFYDDSSSKSGNRKLLIILAVVLALGVLGVIYLLSRPSTKTPAGANVTIAIAPPEAQISVGESHDFSATVTGSGDTDVTWSIAEGSVGGSVVSHGAQAQGGTVASLGVYSAPKTPGTYHVTATSKADPTKAATAEVLVSGK